MLSLSSLRAARATATRSFVRYQNTLQSFSSAESVEAFEMHSRGPIGQPKSSAADGLGAFAVLGGTLLLSISPLIGYFLTPAKAGDH